MGLDISHIQLTKTPVNKSQYFYVDEWELDCNVPLKTYSKYIRTIDDIDFNKTLVIVNNEEQYEILKNNEWFCATDYLKVFIGEIDNAMKKKLAKFVVNQKLDKLETLELGTKHDDITYNTISFGEPVKVQGVYFTDDIGYQNKGMNRLFHDTFGNHFLWGKKEDFELAYTCIGDEWYLKHWGEESVNDMKRNFKENFLDKFEFGKSLLCASF